MKAADARALESCGSPCAARRRTSRGQAAVILLIVLLQWPSAGADVLHDEAEARSRGLAALSAILGQVSSGDLDVRLRARSLAKRIALDYYEANAPEGMRVVPGAIVVTAAGVTCDKGFYLGVHEVTVGEFLEFARKRGLTGSWGEIPANLPVTNVSLDEARAFAASRGARVPTLDEISRAAHGGGRLRYPWGDRFDPARVNSRESGSNGPEAEGSRPGGVSVHGIAHLLGNVAEWTETQADGRRFMVAGGSYRWHAELEPPPYKLEPPSRLPDVGFRLAKSLPRLGP